MAAVVEKPAEDVEEVKLSITLENVNRFDQYTTKEFHVRGNAWNVLFHRTDTDLALLLTLLNLKTKNPETSEDCVIVASFTVEILSTKFDVKPFQTSIKVVSFCSESFVGRGIYRWRELIDPDKEYVLNDSCKIFVRVRASPLFNRMNNDRIEFKQMNKCCDSASTGEFCIKIKKINDFFDVCTPKFTLKNYQWEILV